MTLTLIYNLEQNFLGGADCWRGEKRYAFCFFANRLIKILEGTPFFEIFEVTLTLTYDLRKISSEVRIAGVERNGMHFIFRESVDK